MTQNGNISLATQASGNTKPEAVSTSYKCPKKRGFLITFNGDNVTGNYVEMREHFESLKSCEFITACQEYNKKGNLHIHMYVHFKNAYSIPTTLLKKCNNPHIDPERSSPKQCIDYVRKEGEKWAKKREYQKTTMFWPDFGEEPHQGTLTIKELKSIENSDDLPDWKQYNIWKQLKREHKKTKVNEWKKDVEVIWIQGPSGAGKTKKAVEIMNERKIEEFDEVKHIGEFWHNCDGIGCAVYDDFRDSHMKASEFINFIDYNTHTLNVKGGSIRNLYHTIIITSVQDIDSIYSNMDDEPRQQWMRRIKIIKL